MSQRQPGRLTAVAAYLRMTHLALALGALISPAVTSLSQPLTLPHTATLLVLSVITVAAASLVLASDFPIRSRSLNELLSRLSGPAARWPGAGIAMTSAVALTVLMPESAQRLDFATILPLALALRAVGLGDFWPAAIRMVIAGTLSVAVSATAGLWWGVAWEPLAVLMALLVAFAVLAQDTIYFLAVELDALRARSAERAVIDERRRFAGDLHDIQGQHLQLIAVQTQLISRLIEAGQYGDARNHAGRTQQIAVNAVDEMHRVVHDYREVNLEMELANAARVLQSAGIEVHTHGSVPRLPADQDRLMGRAVREAVANILKHTSASRATASIQVRERDRRPGTELTITDSGPARSARVSGAGTGLGALAQRCRELGGVMSFDTPEGATLSVWLPSSPPEGP